MNQSQARIRVLIVDDNALVRMSFHSVLELSGDIQIIGQAATGGDAVDLACRLRPDLVLMDISLPDIDGMAATRQIRSRCPDVRVVGLTMYTDVSEQMLQSGAVGCLDKALPAAALIAAIRDLWQKGSGPAT